MLLSAVGIYWPAFRLDQLTKAIVIDGMLFVDGTAACPMTRGHDKVTPFCRYWSNDMETRQ